MDSDEDFVVVKYDEVGGNELNGDPPRPPEVINQIRTWLDYTNCISAGDEYTKDPRHFAEFYVSMLAEHSARSGVPQHLQLAILQLVTHSVCQLKLIELASLLKFMCNDKSITIEEAQDLIRASCGQLLKVLEDESLSVVDQSFTEFLMDERRNENENNNSIFTFPVIESSKAHGALALMCLRYLDASARLGLLGDELGNPQEISELRDEEEDESEDDKTPKQIGSCKCNVFGTHLCPFDSFADEETMGETPRLKDLKLKMPLLHYAAVNWHHHLKNGKIEEIAEEETFRSCLDRGKPAFSLWLRMSWHDRRWSNVTPLHVAVYLCLEDYLKWLLTSGALINVRDNKGRSPLSHAAQCGTTRIVEDLIDHGAKLSSKDNAGLRPLHRAALAGRPEVVRVLLKRGADPLAPKTKTTQNRWYVTHGIQPEHKGETAVGYACRSGNLNTLAEFIGYLGPEELCKCLGLSVSGGRPEAIHMLLKSGRVPIDGLAGGETALYLAAKSAKYDYVKVLLENGANPNFVWVYTDLGGKREMLEGEDVQLQSTLAPGLTPMHAFARAAAQIAGPWSVDKERDCLQCLLKAGGSLRARTTRGETPLHMACSPPPYIMPGLKNPSGIIELLLEHGADPSARMDDGSTPLHCATWDPKSMEALVKYGADVNASDNYGRTPLHLLLSPNSNPGFFMDRFQTLLNLGADCNIPDQAGWTSVDLAFRNLRGDSGIMASVGQGVDSSSGNYNGDPGVPFLEEYNEESLRKLVAAGVDFSPQQLYRGPPLPSLPGMLAHF